MQKGGSTVIGALGNISFAVSSRQIRTFDNMIWKSSARYATHERHLLPPLLEYVGGSVVEISMDMVFSVFLKTNPHTEIAKLLAAERNGTAMFLVIGRRILGRNRWIAESTNKKLERFDDRGNLLVASVNVKLKEYLRRGNR